MSKRKPTVPLKKPNVLDPFTETNPSKLEIYKTRENAARRQDLYKKKDAEKILKKIQKSYTALVDKDQKLADFLFSAVTKKLDDIPDDQKYGTLDKLYLLDDPYINPKTKEREDLYDVAFQTQTKNKKKWEMNGPIEQAITLSPNKNSTNPILALIHEVTHALDDNYMRIPQREIIDYLAKLESDNKIKTSGSEIEQLIRDTQKILPGSTNFIDNYPAKKHFISSIQAAMQNVGDKDTEDGVLENEGLANVKKSYAIKNFVQLKKALDLLRKAKIGDNGGDPGQALWEFSEFPAFAVENLNSPWRVSSETNPLSKGFMYTVLEGLQRGLEPFHLSKYPLVVQGFRDRMAQLGDSPIPRPISPKGLLVDSISSPASSKKDKDEEKNEKDPNQNTELS